MDFDADLLARLRFALVVTALGLGVGLSALTVVLEAMWMATRRIVFRDLYRFWIRMFGVAFALSVVAVVVSPQAGTVLDRWVVIGFAMEAGGLGVTLAGWRGIGPRLHFVATLLATTGALMTAFCVLPAYAWFQEIAPAASLPTGFPTRFAHFVLASFMGTALLVGGASARNLLADPLRPEARMGLRMAVGMFAIVTPLQVIAGQGFREMIVRGRGGHPLSFSPEGGVADWAFWLMLACGLAMAGLCVWGVVLAARRGLEGSRSFLRATVIMGPIGFMTLAAGLVAAHGAQVRFPSTPVALADEADPTALWRLVMLTVYLVAIGFGAVQILRLTGRGQINDGRAPGNGEAGNAFAAPLEEDASPPLAIRLVRFSALMLACAVTAGAVAYALRGLLV